MDVSRTSVGYVWNIRKVWVGTWYHTRLENIDVYGINILVFFGLKQ